MTLLGVFHVPPPLSFTNGLGFLHWRGHVEFDPTLLASLAVFHVDVETVGLLPGGGV